MNEWSVAAIALTVCLIPCGIACLRGRAADRIVGLQTAGLLLTLILLLLAESLHRPSFTDLALAVALLAFGGGLVFA